MNKNKSITFTPTLLLVTHNSALSLYYNKEKKVVEIFDREGDNGTLKQIYIASFDETSARAYVRMLMEENYQFWLHSNLDDNEEEDDYLLFRVCLGCFGSDGSYRETLLQHQSFLEENDIENKEEVIKAKCLFSVDLAQRALTLLCACQ